MSNSRTLVIALDLSGVIHFLNAPIEEDWRETKSLITKHISDTLAKMGEYPKEVLQLSVVCIRRMTVDKVPHFSTVFMGHSQVKYKWCVKAGCYMTYSERKLELEKLTVDQIYRGQPKAVTQGFFRDKEEKGSDRCNCPLILTTKGNVTISAGRDKRKENITEGFQDIESRDELQKVSLKELPPIDRIKTICK